METRVNAKGQITLPTELRKRYGIKKGTLIRILIGEDRPSISLAPMTREYIGSFRGILKAKPGEKSMLQMLREDREEDLRREEAKLAKHGIR